jgi:prolyl 4-hydroxylase
MNIYLIFIIVFLLFILLYTNKSNNNIINEDYNIKEFPNFLTHEECDKIIEMSKDHLFVSKIYDTNEDTLSIGFRNSLQYWLNDEDNIFIKNISERIRNATNAKTNYMEPLQVVKYPENGYFYHHYDVCEGSHEKCERMNLGHGPRFMTFIIYLNDDFDGGETDFPKRNIKIKPNKGKAVLFYNTNKKGEILENSFHAGLPITKGNKWITNKWIHLYD